MAGDDRRDVRRLSVFGAEIISGIEERVLATNYTNSTNKRMKGTHKQLKETAQSLFDSFEFSVGQIVRHRSNPDIDFVIAGKMISENLVHWYIVETANMAGKITASNWIREESLKYKI